jgi:hypothetical protein
MAPVNFQTTGCAIHESPDTTAHYAKVDLATLCLIAQPWPGDA